MLPMSKEYRDILDMLQQNVEPMTVNEMFLKGGTPKDWYYRNLPKIPMLIKGEKFDNDANKKVTIYQYNPGQNPNSIPTLNEIFKILDDIINKKTHKTQKTNLENKIEQWFSDNAIKPRKPKTDEKIDENEGVFLRFLTQKKNLQQRGFLVFSVFAFLHERDEKRYKKYYADKIDLTVTENADDKKQSKLSCVERENNIKGPQLEKKSQNQRMKELKEYLQRDKLSDTGVSETALYDNFLSADINQAIQSGILIKLPNGNYTWKG